MQNSIIPIDNHLAFNTDKVKVKEEDGWLISNYSNAAVNLEFVISDLIKVHIIILKIFLLSVIDSCI